MMQLNLELSHVLTTKAHSKLKNNIQQLRNPLRMLDNSLRQSLNIYVTSKTLNSSRIISEETILIAAKSSKLF